MTRVILMAAGLLACLAVTSKAEVYTDSGTVAGFLTGTFSRQDGATSEITTYNFTFSPATANFAFSYDADGNELLGASLYFTGITGPAFFGGGQYPPSSGGATVEDSAPGEGPDRLSASFGETGAPGPQDTATLFELFDASGSYFESGSLAGVLFTASGDGSGGYGDGSGSAYRFSYTFTTAVPEPSSLALCGIGLVGLCVAARRRARRLSRR